jgi:hypothetical protein
VDQLSACLEAGAEGGVHAARLLLETHWDEEEWILVGGYKENAFNEGDRIGMCWTVRVEWPSWVQHTFNCYRHWASIHSKEGVIQGVTQGDPTAMVECGVELLPLIRLLKAAVSDAHQPWHADDAGAGGQFKRIRLYFEKRQDHCPPRECFPESDKTVIVVMEHNKDTAGARQDYYHCDGAQQSYSRFLLLLTSALKSSLEADTMEVSLARRPIRRLVWKPELQNWPRLLS